MEGRGFMYYGFFCLYIAFFMCVLLNTITALFVEAVSRELHRFAPTHGDHIGSQKHTTNALFGWMGDDGNCAKRLSFAYKVLVRSSGSSSGRG